MFKSKSFLVKMVDDPKPDTQPEKTTEPINPIELIDSVGSVAVASIGTAVTAYVFADTVRQILVHITKTVIK